jgi:hypothetical protein
MSSQALHLQLHLEEEKAVRLLNKVKGTLLISVYTHSIGQDYYAAIFLSDCCQIVFQFRNVNVDKHL